MKTKTTMTHITNTYDNVYRCGYCDLQYIMRYGEAQYYNSGVYGWNCDIYTDPSRSLAITTGYRNMRGRVIPSELIEKYSKVAKNIMKDAINATYDEVKEALDQNKENFFNELANI